MWSSLNLITIVSVFCDDFTCATSTKPDLDTGSYFSSSNPRVNKVFNPPKIFLKIHLKISLNLYAEGYPATAMDLLSEFFHVKKEITANHLALNHIKKDIWTLINFGQ